MKTTALETVRLLERPETSRCVVESASLHLMERADAPEKILNSLNKLRNLL